MSQTSFSQRHGLQQSKSIDSDFPVPTRLALAHLLLTMYDKNYLLNDWNKILTEIYGTGRLAESEFNFDFDTSFSQRLQTILPKLQWHQVYQFCERVYQNLLESQEYFDEERGVQIVITSIADVQKFFTDELNLILAEDNLAFHFVHGKFERRGRAQTQVNFQRVGTVLNYPILSNVRSHYSKARKFFDERPNADLENCIKESICALEACVEALTEKPASNDFTKVINQLKGNGPKQIPAPIAEARIKLHAYRGSGQGVAHAALQGNKVSEAEAELVLSLVATYITYLVDLLMKLENEVPF
jgi:hypothetical protein